eukprot:COSAG02_NODE_7423_length_3023_cov_2.153215_1_plen_67_part_00
MVASKFMVTAISYYSSDKRNRLLRHCDEMELAPHTSALRVVEHRLRDAVKHWEEGEASGGASGGRR